MQAVIDGFRAAIVAAGMTPPDVIEPGHFHRFPGAGKRNGNTAGWCKLFPDGMGGTFGDYSRDFAETWQARRDRRMSLPEHDAFRRNCERARAEALAERERAQEEAAKRAAELWERASVADAHAYLARKGVKPSGVRVAGDSLLVPMRDAAGKLWNVQRIGSDGAKRFLAEARVTGCYHAIGKSTGTICIAEGYATAASVHEAPGHAVAVAFNAGNLEPVARALREKYPDARLILCADDDYLTEGNPGIAKATAAALAVGGLVAFPDFGDERPDGATDFNDLAQAQGLEAVQRAIANARAPEVSAHQQDLPNAPVVDSEGAAWPDPQPLAADAEVQPYPLDALPVGIREAVAEVVDFVQCPPALAACSALSALSLAAQALADVERAPSLKGPASLYLLSVGDSGERKTTCDGRFLEAIVEWERDESERAKPDVARHVAECEAWEARRDGLKAAIREAAKWGKDCRRLESELATIAAEKPPTLRVPRLIYGDATPEALACTISRGWPSAGVMSSEAGIVFGGHGMGRDSVMRQLALLNVLWEAGTVRVDRKSSDSFAVTGARLTMGLAVQPETVRQFMEGTRGLARGTGFAARFLISAPESTQGTRLFRDPPEWRHLPAWKARLRDLLAIRPSMTEAGILTPPTLTLSLAGRDVWRAFHDDVERELRASGDMADVRDVGSKAADNVARMAALFHIFARGPHGEVGADMVQAAARIVGWHLYQARRFLGDVAAPRELSIARRLDAWILDRCARDGVHELPRREIQNAGPNPVRNRATLETALAELANAHRIRQLTIGRRELVVVNPALLGGRDGAS